MPLRSSVALALENFHIRWIGRSLKLSSITRIVSNSGIPAFYGDFSTLMILKIRKGDFAKKGHDGGNLKYEEGCWYKFIARNISLDMQGLSHVQVGSLDAVTALRKRS